MNKSADPATGDDAPIVLARATASSVRVVVVPTATMRRRSRERRRDAPRCRRADFVSFGLEAVILDALDAYRLKRPVADVERDLSDLDAAGSARRQQAPA